MKRVIFELFGLSCLPIVKLVSHEASVARRPRIDGLLLNAIDNIFVVRPLFEVHQ